MSPKVQETSPKQIGNIPIAIVGMSCMFPQSPDKQSFWRVLRRGEDCITEVPPTHWSVADLYDGDPSSPDRTYAKVGGFLSPYEFDPVEFSIPPNTLEAIDTSQLLALVGAKEALRDAGYGEGGKELPRDRTSITLGITGCLELVIPLGARLGHPYWRKALYDAGIDEETSEKIISQISDSYVGWQENSFPGLLGNVVAGRIANRLDLHGTNCVVDAACASSLAALHMGMMELQAGQADMVISGGVDTFNDIFMFECFSKTPALSHKGITHPFAEDADGILLGEGVGIVVLKRLSDAERDGDRIYAVIKGLGSSSDGNSGAIYAPDSAGQRLAVERAYKNANIDPATIDIIEAHGTGTKKGDIVEFEGLQSYFGNCREERQWCALGTVKSQIGHTKAAAGSASLCKMALALYNKVLLPTINVSHPHPNLDIENSAFFLNDISRPWLKTGEHPRRGAVSAFGFGGSNFHVVLEEYDDKRQQPAWDGSVNIFAYSADTKEELIEKIKAGAKAAKQNTAYQAKCSCEKFSTKSPWKATCATNKPHQAEETLLQLAESIKEGKSLPSGCFASNGETSEAPQIAFLFPGQGSQYLHMGSEIAAVFPEVLQAFQIANEQVPPEQRPYEKIFPSPYYDSETEAQRLAELTATQATQVALGTIEMSSANVLRRFGVEPQAVAGHSYGELVALYVAGRLTAEELFRLSALRGRLMAAGDGGRGGMIAISSTEDVATEVAKEVGNLTVANRNHPKQFVLTGLKESVKKAQVLCKERKITARPLQVSAAFHSELMESAVEPFGEALQQASFAPSNIPVYANLTGDIYPEESCEARKTLAKQLVSAVNFIDIVENMYARGFKVFVEVGPKGVLGGLVKGIMNGRPYHMLSTDSRKGGGELHQLALCLAELACLGADVKLDRWEEKRPTPRDKKFPITICGANYRQPGHHSPAPWREPKEPAPNYKKLEPKVIASAKMATPNSESRPSPKAISEPSAKEDEPSAPIKKAVSKDSYKTSSVSDNSVLSFTQSAPKVAPAVREEAVAPKKVSTSKPQGTTKISSSKMNTNQQNPQFFAPTPSNMVCGAMNPLQESIVALQTLQQQTAYAHQRFLETQAQIQCALQTIMSQYQYMAPGMPIMPTMATMAPAYPQMANPMMAMMGNSMIASPMGMTPMAMPQPAPMMANMPMMAPPIPLVPGISTLNQPQAIAPNSTPAIPTVAVPQVATTSTIPQTTSISTSSQSTGVQVAPKFTENKANIQPTVTATKAKTSSQELFEPQVATSETKSAHSKVSLSETILSIVAEKTGYPAEMLNLGMDMEADLGIDSIKRVEILAAIEEKCPGVKSIAPDEIGNLHTLQQVIDRLQSNGAETLSQAHSSPDVKKTGATTPGDLNANLLSIVAEKTGYPAEMLNLDMDMEADLGIDSIKRVEILAAIEEKIPSVKSITPDEIGNLHTLRQVVERLSDGITSNAVKSSADVGDFEKAVMQIISEKTGYPTEMLNLDMDIEADLGIDSIKRVEILAAIEEKCPGSISISSEEVSGLHTLRQIVERFRPFDLTTPPEGGPKGSSQGEGSKSSQKSAITSAIASNALSSTELHPYHLAEANKNVPISPLERRALRYRESRAPKATGLPGGAGPYLLLDDGFLAVEAQKVLELRGAEAFLATPAQIAKFSPHFGPISLSDEEEQLKEQLSKIKGLIAFIPRSPNAGWDDSYCQIIKDCFLSLQAVAPALSSGKSLWATVSRLDGRMGLGGEAFNPLEGGLHSLGKVICQEWPDTVCRAIDLDPHWDREEAAVALIDELSCPGAMEVGLSANSRIVPELCPAPFTPNELRSWESGKVIIVSGGARGVTASCVKTMAKQLHPTFILLGRSPLPKVESPELAQARTAMELKGLLFKQAQQRGEKLSPAQLEREVRSILSNREVRQTLDELRSEGCKVEYISIDVRNAQEVADVVDAVRFKYGAIHGLIHAAGVLADRKIVDKTRAQFDSVFDTKIYGLMNLLEATRRDALEFIAFFSSVTARFGRPGQSDYAIANEIMNKAARYESQLRPNARVVSIGWGPWDGGMVDDGLRREFAKIGAELIPRDQGALALTDEIVYGKLGQAEIIMGSGFSLPREADLEPKTYDFPADSAVMPVLEDHSFGGKSILPLAFAMEYFAQAAVRRYPHLQFLGVDNIIAIKPTPIAEGNIARVTCEAGIAEGRLILVPATLSVGEQICASATVVMSPVLLFNDFIPIPTVSDEGSELSIAEAYERFLFHGKELQAITSLISCSSQGIVADVHSAPSPLEWIKGEPPRFWMSDPLIADCSLQLGLIWSGYQQGCYSLPLEARSYRQFVDKFPSSVRLSLKITKHTGMLFWGDVAICSDTRVLALWSDIRWMMDSSLNF